MSVACVSLLNLVIVSGDNHFQLAKNQCIEVGFISAWAGDCWPVDAFLPFPGSSRVPPGRGRGGGGVSVHHKMLEDA